MKTALELVALILVVGCAGSSPPAEPSPPIASFDERLAADLTWRPGDAEPTAREVVRTTPAPAPDAAVTPVRWSTEIRNRCGEPASFAVGPEAPATDAPTNLLARGEAIVTFITSDEQVFLRTVSGWTSADAAGGWIVFTGDAACEAATGVHRAPPPPRPERRPGR